MKSVIRGFDSTAYLDDLAAGDLVAAHAYSSDLLQARIRTPTSAFAPPRDGALRWVDSMVVPVDAPRPESSYDFHLLLPRARGRCGQLGFQSGSTPGTPHAVEFIPEEILDDPVIFPPEEILESLVFTSDLGPDEELYEAAWERVLEG